MSTSMNFSVKSYQELSLDEFYEIMKLRIDVFVVEQNCPYPEIDGKDKKSLHLIMKSGDELAGYLRILPEGVSYDTPSIGRVIIAPAYRGKELGQILVQKGIDHIVENFENKNITIGAQAPLVNFYGSLGFEQISEIYLEDDIPHMDMIRVFEKK